MRHCLKDTRQAVFLAALTFEETKDEPPRSGWLTHTDTHTHTQTDTHAYTQTCTHTL